MPGKKRGKRGRHPSRPTGPVVASSTAVPADQKARATAPIGVTDPSDQPSPAAAAMASSVSSTAIPLPPEGKEVPLDSLPCKASLTVEETIASLVTIQAEVEKIRELLAEEWENSRCLISTDTFIDPVTIEMATAGKSFSRQSIITWLGIKLIDPSNREPVPPDYKLVQNPQVQAFLTEKNQRIASLEKLVHQILVKVSTLADLSIRQKDEITGLQKQSTDVIDIGAAAPSAAGLPKPLEQKTAPGVASLSLRNLVSLLPTWLHPSTENFDRDIVDIQQNIRKIQALLAEKWEHEETPPRLSGRIPNRTMLDLITEKQKLIKDLQKIIETLSKQLTDIIDIPSSQKKAIDALRATAKDREPARENTAANSWWKKNPFITLGGLVFFATTIMSSAQQLFTAKKPAALPGDDFNPTPFGAFDPSGTMPETTATLNPEDTRQVSDAIRKLHEATETFVAESILDTTMRRGSEDVIVVAGTSGQIMPPKQQEEEIMQEKPATAPAETKVGSALPSSSGRTAAEESRVQQWLDSMDKYGFRPLDSDLFHLLTAEDFERHPETLFSLLQFQSDIFKDKHWHKLINKKLLNYFTPDYEGDTPIAQFLIQVAPELFTDPSLNWGSLITGKSFYAGGEKPHGSIFYILVEWTYENGDLLRQNLLSNQAHLRSFITPEQLLAKYAQSSVTVLEILLGTPSGCAVLAADNARLLNAISTEMFGPMWNGEDLESRRNMVEGLTSFPEGMAFRARMGISAAESTLDISQSPVHSSSSSFFSQPSSPAQAETIATARNSFPGL